MIFIIDSNILISALIRDSMTRRVLVESGWTFYYPEIAFHEIRKYKGLIIEKSKMIEAEYFLALNLLLKHMILIPEERFMGNLKEADELLGKINPDDVVFLALAMSMSDAKIWSNDPHLHKQEKVKALKTHEMVKLFEMTGD